MIDIDFYMKAHEMKRRVMAGNAADPATLAAYLAAYRSRYPVIYNVETTNACNMTCPFCPRTTRMTRPIRHMQPEVFYNLVGQIEPHDDDLWYRWVDFAEKEYHVPQGEQSENAFFLYVIVRALVLHGYGDPLLDPNMPDYVYRLSARGIPSYFSCNPHNINLERLEKIYEAGLTYLKFSVDSLSEPARGRDSFAKDYPLITKALELKEKYNYTTQIVITMIDLGREDQQEQYAALLKTFKNSGAYVYLKSLDQGWMLGKTAPASIHWREFCQMPWSSMTINAEGLAVSCQEDFNGEIVLGDTRTESLYDIWNGKKYRELRRAHFRAPADHRCWERCDMKPIGKWLRKD